MRIRKKRLAGCCLALLAVPLLLPPGVSALLSASSPGDHSSRARCEYYQWLYHVDVAWQGDCRKQAWQTGGIGHLRTVVAAQSLYRERTGRYAKTYQELIDARLLMDCARTGYRIRIVTRGAGWSATSLPACPVCTIGGSHSFYADQTGVVRVGEPGDPPPTAASPPL